MVPFRSLTIAPCARDLSRAAGLYAGFGLVETFGRR
jgi:hypothetical protein